MNMIMDPATDTRNVTDDFKGMNGDIIRGEQEKRRTDMVVISLNMTQDFNKGSILRAFSAMVGKRFIFLNKPNDQIIGAVEGTKRWDKRGAVGTQNYNHIEHLSIERWKTLLDELRAEGYTIFAVDNTVGYDPKPMYNVEIPKKSVLIFGEEQRGIPTEIIDYADEMIFIPQFGVSPRSLNVAQSAGIAFYEYMRQNYPVGWTE